MVEVTSSQRHDVYESPSDFKIQKVFAVRDFPRGLWDPRIQYSSCFPAFRKYPPPKTRKGIPVNRDFPVKRNAPAAFTNQSRKNSNPYGSTLALGLFTAGCKQLDVSNDTNAHGCPNAEPDNLSVAKNFNPSDVPESTTVHVHECANAELDNLSVVKNSKPSNIPESTNVHVHECSDAEPDLSVVMLDVPESTNVRVHECVNTEPDSLPVIKDPEPSDVPESTNVCDVHGCTEPNNDNVERSNFSMVPWDGQCQKNVSIETNVYECADIKEPSPLMVVRDAECQEVLFGLDEGQGVLKDEEREKVIPSIAEGVSLPNEQCYDVPLKAHDYQDYQATFSDEGCLSDEDCERATLTDLKNSEGGLSNDLTVPYKKSRINSDKVKEVLNLFREVYLELLQGMEGKPKGCLLMHAASIFLKQGKGINEDRRLGPVPGVEVGDYFDWRAELNVIGLHRQNYHGIDYMDLNGKIIATSIVDSGRYDNVSESSDEQEFPETLIYSGEGENPRVYKKSVDDQKLKGGNLALKNSAVAKTPIRVIRKVPFKGDGRRKSSHKFVYDGLYFVDSFRQEKGPSGKLIFKFLLKRFPGQPKADVAKLTRKRKAKVDQAKSTRKRQTKVAQANSARKERVSMNDISQGKERIPVRAMNALDDEEPPFFNYVLNVINTYHPSMTHGGCDCINGCSDSEDCSCIIKNGGAIYNYGECIMKEKPLVIECGPSCKCFTSCINRVSQRGTRFPLEVFKTETKGWGVRSRSFIPYGSFICEYTGEIIQDREGELRIGNDEYLFDIGNSYGGDSLQDTNNLASSKVNESFIIDAAQFGNVGRFINHSCSPNLFAQNALFDHCDKSMPHIMLFATEDIRPLEELTYDYNYKIGSVRDANGNIKMKPCYCGSSKCTGRMY